MSTVEVKGVKTIILDIEGTLCPIWFVSRVLYPYATANLPNTVTSQWDEPSFSPYKSAFPDCVRTDPEAVIKHCLDLAAKDVKDPAWKKLQGLIWRQGYADGVLAVPLFTDVAPVLKGWREEGFELAIFSSGSVEAQKLFFGYVDPKADLSAEEKKDDGEDEDGKERHGEDKQNGMVDEPIAGVKRKVDDAVDDEDAEPAKKSKVEPEELSEQEPKENVQDAKEKIETEDLNSLFIANFDTINAGPKIVAASYEKIVKELGKEAGECLFLSDNVKEIVAAKEAGLYALIVDRPGNAPLSEDEREKETVVTSLEQVDVVIEA